MHTHPQTLIQHFEELAAHGVDTVALSWWGRLSISKGDSQGVVTDANVRNAIHVAERVPGAPKVRRCRRWSTRCEHALVACWQERTQGVPDRELSSLREECSLVSHEMLHVC